jgi:hypothetical protein
MARSSAPTISSAPTATRSASAADRVLVTLALFLGAIAAATLFLIAAGILPAHEVIADELMRQRMLGFAIGRYRVAVAGVSGLAGLGLTLLMVRRFSAPRTASLGRASGYIVLDDARGFVVVEPDAIAALAGSSLRRISGIADRDIRVSGPTTGPVRLHVRAVAINGIDLKRLGERIRQSTRQAVEELAGLEVQDVIVRLDVVPSASLELSTL